MSRHPKVATTLTVIVVAGVIAAAYFMGRSDERAGRPLRLVKPAQAAETPTLDVDARGLP